MTRITLTFDVPRLDEDAALTVGNAIAHHVLTANEKDLGHTVQVSLYHAPCSRAALARAYVAYCNDYLLPEVWAEHNGLHLEEGQKLLGVLRSCHEQPHPEN